MKFATIILFVSVSLSACSAGGHFSIHEENDFFSGTKTDRFYSQGAKFTYAFPSKEDKSVDSISLGNNIFTPEDKHIQDSIPWQRPYAGYSYGEFARTSYRNENKSVQDRWAVQFGVVGPGSDGKFFQCSVHKLLGEDCPAGWANQLRDEPTVELLAEERRKTSTVKVFGLEGDGVINYGADLGNVRIAANTGFIMRLGIIGPDFGPVDITPRLDREGSRENFLGSGPLQAAYFFSGVEGHAVARNIFLDGNTFEASERVTKYPFVADLKLGFALQYQEYKLTYSWIHTTDEYRDSKSSQSFGSIDISWGW